MILTEQEKLQINELAARVEGSTGVQVLAVAAVKSDAYPEIPWKAFSLGASLAALVLTVAVSLKPAWAAVPPVFWGTVILGAGMALALSGIFAQPVARAFLGEIRAAAETRQFAMSLFLERGLSRTQARNAILILVSRFERRAAIVSDTGIIGRITQAALDKISADAEAILVRGSVAAALTHSLAALERLLQTGGFAVTPRAADEISGEFMETEGPRP